MSDNTDTNRMKEELEKDTRDVSDLWNEALRRYKGIVGVDLQPKDELRSVEAMVAYGTEQMNNFHKFRHDQKKVDKLRGLLKSNLDYIEKGAQQLIQAATPAFPPAAAIGTAFTYMLSACRQVSADYDVVAAFFEDMNSFLQRITILESRLPGYPAYRNCLMDVFTSLLEMCAFATKYIELGRFKKWIMNMISGQDGDLGDARKKMDTSLSRLQSATEYAILGNTEELQRMNADLRENQEMQTRMMEAQTRMLENVIEGQDAVRNDLMSIQKLLVVFNERRREEPSKQTGTKATSRNKPPTSNRVRSFLPDTISPSHEYHNIKDNLIPDTCTWLFEEREWLEWVSPSSDNKLASRILAISGNPGAGKSHLATAAHDQLMKLAEKDPGSNKCVVHFFFRETVDELCEFNNAINWMVIQIAEQDATLCEKINVQIAREDIEFDFWDWKDIWSKLVKPLFVGQAKAHLQIVLDGLDELSGWETERDSLFEFLREVKVTADLHVSVLCTTRPDLVPKLKQLEVSAINLTKEKQLPDLKAVIWSHLNNDGNLRKFSRYIKQRISSKLEEKADGLLYAENILRRLNTIGREPVVLRLLDQSMPESLTDLYSDIVADIQRHTTEEQQKGIKWLLEWLAYSYRPLTLAECLDLVKLGPAGSFNLEEELQGQQLTKVIRIADASERFSEEPEPASEDALNLETQQDPDNAYRDDDLPLKFQDRSIRSYFRDATPGEEGLRTPLRAAHGQMLLLCVSILSGAVHPGQKSLNGYAAENWLLHFSWWLHNIHSVDVPDEEKITHLEAFVSVMTNRGGNYATAIEAASMNYEDVMKAFILDQALGHMNTAAEMVQGLGDKVTPETLAWANEVSANRKTAFLQLARAHVINWLRSEDAKSVLQSYKVVRSVVKLTNLTDLIDEEGSDSDSDDSDDPKSTAEEILGISKAFKDIVLDSNAHLAVALLLEDHEHHDEALAEAQEALSDCTDPVLHFRIQKLIATVQLSLECEEDALESITECLSYKDVSSAMLREAYVEQGRIQVALERLDDARISYEEARLADPEAPMPGNLLQEEFDVYKDKNADAELIGVVKSWKPIERLAWMTWNYDDVDEQHEVFRRASGRIGEQDFMKNTYEEVISLLDTVGAAAPMRYELAISQWRVRGDIDAAKSLLNEILDSTSTGELYKFTDEDPAFVLVQSLLLMTEIIYEQFRVSSDRAIKAKLFAEAKQLTQRPLAHSVAAVKSELAPHFVTLARMARKMGPMLEFQDTLTAAFDECYGALNDGIGWNDSTNLNSLSMVLSTLGGLETEARILFSAQFSELEPEESDEEEDDDDDDEDDDDEGSAEPEEEDDDDEDDDSESEEGTVDGDNETATDEGDLADIDYSCDGECEPMVEWTAWKGVPMYQCLICSACFLCESCYQKRQKYNEDSQSGSGNLYCGAKHRYIKGPIEGWKGIKDGVMSIEGQDSVSFKTWLADLKETKWKEAWNQFWLSEA